MEIEVSKKEPKLGDDKKKILYPGSRLFIMEGGRIQGMADVLKNPAKFISYRQLAINEVKAVTKEGGREVISVNGNQLEIDANTVVVNNDTKFEQKDGQKKLFVTNNEKLAREMAVNTNILERERLKAVRDAVEKQIQFIDDIIQADSQFV